MIFNSKKIATLFNKYYYSYCKYDYRNDPNLTYKELIFGLNASKSYNPHMAGYVDIDNLTFDTDKMFPVLDVWNECIAKLYRNAEYTNDNWENVLVNRAEMSPTNIIFNAEGKIIPWYSTDKYSDEKIKMDLAEDEKLRKEKAIYEEWVLKKKKNNEYQRKRRALIKHRLENGDK